MSGLMQGLLTGIAQHVKETNDRDLTAQAHANEKLAQQYEEMAKTARDEFKDTYLNNAFQLRTLGAKKPPKELADVHSVLFQQARGLVDQSQQQKQMEAEKAQQAESEKVKRAQELLQSYQSNSPIPIQPPPSAGEFTQANPLPEPGSLPSQATQQAPPPTEALPSTPPPIGLGEAGGGFAASNVVGVGGVGSSRSPLTTPPGVVYTQRTAESEFQRKLDETRQTQQQAFRIANQEADQLNLKDPVQRANFINKHGLVEGKSKLIAVPQGEALYDSEKREMIFYNPVSHAAQPSKVMDVRLHDGRVVPAALNPNDTKYYDLMGKVMDQSSIASVEPGKMTENQELFDLARKSPKDPQAREEFNRRVKVLSVVSEAKETADMKAQRFQTLQILQSIANPGNLKPITADQQDFVNKWANLVVSNQANYGEALRGVGGDRGNLFGHLNKAITDSGALIVPQVTRDKLASFDQGIKDIGLVSTSLNKLVDLDKAGKKGSDEYLKELAVLKGLETTVQPSLARANGHTGVLTQLDVEGSSALVPGVLGASMAPSLARQKLDVLINKLHSSRDILTTDSIGVMMRGGDGQFQRVDKLPAAPLTSSTTPPPGPKTYSKTANGGKFGSNDGKTWFNTSTGKQIDPKTGEDK